MAEFNFKRVYLAGWFALFAGLVCCGCAGKQYVYTVQPAPVVIHPAQEAWGVEAAIQLTDAIYLEVFNKSVEPVRIVWEDCAYIDVDGRSHRLRTANGDLAAQIPVSVAPGSRVEVALLPVEDSMSNSNDPLLPGEPKRTRRQEGFWLFRGSQYGRDAVGRPVTVFLALERNGSRRTVKASYTITGIDSERRS